MNLNEGLLGIEVEEVNDGRNYLLTLQYKSGFLSIELDAWVQSNTWEEYRSDVNACETLCERNVTDIKVNPKAAWEEDTTIMLNDKMIETIKDIFTYSV